MNVQPFESPLGPNSLSSLAGNIEGGSPFDGEVAPAEGDNISRFVPPWLNNGSAASYNNPAFQGLFGPLMGMLQQLVQMLQSLMGYGGNGSCQPYNGERFFQNASGSSDGDPHLSFNGNKWTSMDTQPDLLNSNSFAGGYRVSTQATQPNAKGVTWNQSATVSLNNGATTVSMNDGGEPSINSYGQSLSIARGQTRDLGNGESVSYEKSGSLRITAQNGAGGEIATTFDARGNGVDVDITARDADLGGALVNGYGSPPWAGPRPVPALWPESPTPPIAYPQE